MTASARSRSAISRASRAKGARFEQELARYLRTWWPGAVRAVRTGSSAAADPGDIAGLPGMIVSAKDVAAEHERRDSTWATWWSELEAMLAADPAALGVIVVKRPQQPDPGGAWAHLYLSDLVALHVGMAPRGPSQVTATGERDRTPVRVRLGDLVELLVAAGYARGAA